MKSPGGSFTATITTIRGRWYAEFEHGGRRHRLPVRKDDAWTYDIEDGLALFGRLEDGCFRIAGRKGKDRYVPVGYSGLRI